MHCYENELVYPSQISKQKFEDCMDLLLINNDNKSHNHMSISKILTDLCLTKQNIKIINTFADTVYNVLLVKTSCKNKKRCA